MSEGVPQTSCGCPDVAQLRREVRALRVVVEAVPDLFEYVEQLAAIVQHLTGHDAAAVPAGESAAGPQSAIGDAR
ncbi:hypothetical protein AB0C38_43535 [Amycolatopsis sp. NPDC048633]|uniref:hypothetical protein n=1 Tax=Amycolatopsis sp. NPDC048633 TaxID=3157095 RepID=UPI0033E03ACE